MAQYIDIYLDHDDKNKSNPGLYSIIEYIGRKESKLGESLSRKQAYRAGKKYINSRLKKWNKTAIERLVKATNKKVACDYSCKQTKFVWKIHNRKARKIMKTIHDILVRYNDPEVYAVFATICMGRFNNGADAAGFPYYSRIKNPVYLSSNGFSEKEIKCLKKCSSEISTFSEFYSV